jgi:hypothetical protein
MASMEISLGEARRLALAAQGFGVPKPRKTKIEDVGAAIRRMGVLQLDFVNVLGPSHYTVLFSRLGPYPQALLDAAVYQRREFTEQWAHEASIVPMETWPLLAARRETHRVRPYGFERFLARHPDYTQWVLDQVCLRGPLTAADVPEPQGVARKIPGDWNNTVPRAVLEAHFGRGLLAVAGRLPSFARVYDLAERVIAKQHYRAKVSKEEAERSLLQQAAQASGVATAADLADYYRMSVRQVRPRIEELVDAGQLLPARVEGWREAAYLDPGARPPQRMECSALLSPFDPLIWRRSRTSRLFGFECRLEVFVPREERRWGFYVLPYLLGERLVARVDLKADRGAGRLVALAAYVEPDADRRRVAEALAGELATMARWLELGGVDVAGRSAFDRQLKAARAS